MRRSCGVDAQNTLTTLAESVALCKKVVARQFTYIKLSSIDEDLLRHILATGKQLSRELTRGRILLLNHEGQKLSDIAKFLNINYVSVTQIVNRYKQNGLQSALYDRPRSGAPRKITERVEAQVTAIACSEQPDGQVRWTLELLHDKFIQVNTNSPMVDSLSKESVRTILKKVNLNPGRPKNGVLKS